MSEAATQDDGASQASEAELKKCLTFTVSDEVYAFGIEAVSEIIEYANVTRIPMAPACIKGMFNLRGHVLPLISLAQRLGKPDSEIDKKTSIVVLSIPYKEGMISLGVVVDAINQVIEVDETMMEPRPEFGVGVDARFVEAMAKLGKGFVALLNVDEVFSVEEMTRLIGEFSRDTYARFCQEANA